MNLLDTYSNDELRKALQPLINNYKTLAKQFSQSYVYNLPPTVQSSLQELTNAISNYQYVLNRASTYSVSINTLTAQLDAVWGEQLQQLQYATRNLQVTLQNPVFSQLTETIDVVSTHFKNYNDAISFTVPDHIQKELQQAYEEAESIDIDLEDEALDIDDTFKKQDLSKVSFMDKLMMLLNILTLIVSVHGNYLQLQANEIEKDKVEKLESIDNHLEIITDYIHDYIENYDELNNNN